MLHGQFRFSGVWKQRLKGKLFSRGLASFICEKFCVWGRCWSLIAEAWFALSWMLYLEEKVKTVGQIGSSIGDYGEMSTVGWILLIIGPVEIEMRNSGIIWGCNMNYTGGEQGEIEESIIRSSVEVDSTSFNQNGLITAPQLTIDKNLLVDPKLIYIGSKVGEGAHGKVYEGR